MDVYDYWRSLLRGASDEQVKRPLWEFPPSAAKAVLSERRRRGLMQDAEDLSPDPEYH